MKPNESAFPELKLVESSEGRLAAYTGKGLTARDYAALRAPAEIPNWFIHTRKPEPMAPALPVGKEKEAQDWIADGCFDFSPETDPVLYQFQEEYGRYETALADWSAGNLEARYFQWRFYYADMMIAESEKLTGRVGAAFVTTIVDGTITGFAGVIET